ncbi:uncharacterized protein TNCV_3322351 [Trichonephila clavipes]|nr:uncharacterized protein TNCV_3322351 [Trichonephila clavipes]
MGTRLHRLKAHLKGQILTDCKCLSGKNILIEHVINTLQPYYGSAIQRNHISVKNMRRDIWTIFLHTLSNDEYPQHGFGSVGEDSWWGFKKAETSVPIGLTWNHDIFSAKPSPCLHNGDEADDLMGLEVERMVQISTLGLKQDPRYCEFKQI